MKYKNRLKRLEARLKWWDSLSNKTGYTRPGSRNK